MPQKMEGLGKLGGLESASEIPNMVSGPPDSTVSPTVLCWREPGLQFEFAIESGLRSESSIQRNGKDSAIELGLKEFLGLHYSSRIDQAAEAHAVQNIDQLRQLIRTNFQKQCEFRNAQSLVLINSLAQLFFQSQSQLLNVQSRES